MPDTLLPTQDQLLVEAIDLLGFKRRGKNIIDAIVDALKPPRR